MDVLGKTGERMKGKPPAVKIKDVEDVPCPAVSTDEVTINHSIVNLGGNYGHRGHRCEFCEVSWADLDQQVRDDAQAAEKKRLQQPRRR